MRDIELKLILELMKNSRRSDRDLAKAIGTSQPTVSRLIKRLEKEGYIKQYTMLPDFSKLGFELMAFTFVSFTKALTSNETSEVRKAGRELLKKNPIAILMGVNGLGLGYDRLLVSLHENYASSTKIKALTTQVPNVDPDQIETYIINLADKDHFYPLGFSLIADYLLTMKQQTRKTKTENKAEDKSAKNET